MTVRWAKGFGAIPSRLQPDFRPACDSNLAENLVSEMMRVIRHSSGEPGGG
jgi:hypothetical protein